MNILRKNKTEELLLMLQQTDFAIYETVLYLNAYPHSKEALDHYHMLINRRKEIVTAYEAMNAPLTMLGNESKSSWDWVKTPMPWEAQ